MRKVFSAHDSSLSKERTIMNQDSFVLHLISKYGMTAHTDAVGTGALFEGPVACAVAMPEPFQNDEVDDSKRLEHKTIYRLAPELKQKVVYAFGVVRSEEMQSIRNNMKAELMAMTRAVLALQKKIKIDAVFVDGKFTLPDTGIPSYAVIRGDQNVFGIAVASILAKNDRDHFMIDTYGEEYSRYRIASNKGYRSPDHLMAIRKWGTVWPHHRAYLPQVQRVLKGEYDEVIFSKYRKRWETLCLEEEQCF